VFNYLFESSSGDASDWKLKKCSSGKIGAYLINLDRAEERLRSATRSLEGLRFPLERVSAVDGLCLSVREMTAMVDVATYSSYFKMFPELGSIGCALSHEKAWRKFLGSDYEYAIIFEDDVQVDPPELEKTIESLAACSSLWDLVLLEVIHRGSPIKIAPLGKGRSLVVYLTDVRHSGCYLINRKAAAALLEKFYPIKMPLDHYFTAAWEFDIKLLGVEPRFVHQQLGSSQIKTGPSTRISTPGIRCSNAAYIIRRALTGFSYNCIIAARLKKKAARIT
jgi:glycosyl transferase family 25